MTAQVLGSLPPMSEILPELWAPGFSLAQSWLLWTFGESTDSQKISFLCLSLCLCFKCNGNFEKFKKEIHLSF